MGTLLCTPGRILQFRPIEGGSESLDACIQDPSGKSDYHPLMAGEHAFIAIRLPSMGETIEYSRLDKPLAPVSYIRLLVIPFHVRNDAPDLQEFEIF